MKTNYPKISPFGIDGKNHTPPMKNSTDHSLLMFLSPFDISDKG
jgi:hypothetical protein